MPTKTELEATLNSAQFRLEKLDLVTIEYISKEECDANGCEEEADYKVHMVNQELDLCYQHKEQVLCILRSLGWGGKDA